MLFGNPHRKREIGRPVCIAEGDTENGYLKNMF